jgi:hypothetical protein
LGVETRGIVDGPKMFITLGSQAEGRRSTHASIAVAGRTGGAEGIMEAILGLAGWLARWGWKDG